MPKNIQNGKKITFNENESNTISFIVNKNDKNLPNQKLNTNNHEKDESEINNFDISFFLSKDLKEKIEGIDEPINNGEIKLCSNDKLSYFFNKNKYLNEINKVNNYA